MSVSLASLASNSNINFSTEAPVNNVTRWTNYTFVGKVGYAVAKAFGDVEQLVASSKAYFRPGSSTDSTSIEYIMVKESESTPVVVIPEPLITLSTVTLVTDVVHYVTISDDISTEDLTAILSGNGLKQFVLTNNQQ